MWNIQTKRLLIYSTCKIPSECSNENLGITVFVSSFHSAHQLTLRRCTIICSVYDNILPLTHTHTHIHTHTQSLSSCSMSILNPHTLPFLLGVCVVGVRVSLIERVCFKLRVRLDLLFLPFPPWYVLSVINLQFSFARRYCGV